MGMSTDVVGIRPPNAKWKQMKAVWDACEEADVEPPGEVLEFFDHEPPDNSGVVIRLKESTAVSEWHSEMEEGFEVHLDRLPPDIKTIRFYNSF